MPSSIADRVAGLTGRDVATVIPLGTSHTWELYRAERADASPLFVKAAAGHDPDGVPVGLFRAEALGLGWLRRSFGAPVPAVAGWDDTMLVLDWVEESAPSPEAAERFGHALAAMHLAGADSFGAEWDGYIGPLPLDNTPHDSWPEFYAEQRVRPYLRRAADRGALTASDVRLVEKVLDAIDDLAGTPEPPARLHGDLWNGNVIWQDDGAVAVDPAAHGGHRETDLAMLSLFGLPHLDRVRDAYNEAAPLASGWRARVPLHQLHPLLVHVCLYGAAYRTTALEAARAALNAG
ncbi:fructosamine kinase family protein [Marinactinospora thermotolerans]|uniref:Fructosamine-3-kinase n=1 Tax=Marinactinospora thermotolerans DSM 45154 TaxID=1122192 RepID=A0A1T4RUT5_9ACTN|nr:fructosamine kinase family protein [Marinactinospora thermotolerans]SKA19723.1 Fructosamine-3-kinase [Marinactinospora thermotolerans DSM 45154]